MSESTPEEFLAKSQDVLKRGSAPGPLSAALGTAYALQGILALQIIQHRLQFGEVDGDDFDDGEPVANPLGECAQGHEIIDAECEDCQADVQSFQSDTVVLQDGKDGL